MQRHVGGAPAQGYPSDADPAFGQAASCCLCKTKQVDAGTCDLRPSRGLLLETLQLSVPRYPGCEDTVQVYGHWGLIRPQGFSPSGPLLPGPPLNKCPVAVTTRVSRPSHDGSAAKRPASFHLPPRCSLFTVTEPPAGKLHDLASRRLWPQPHLEGPPIWAAHYVVSGSPASINAMPCGFPCRAQACCLADYVQAARDCPPSGSGLAPADHAPPCSPPDTACVLRRDKPMGHALGCVVGERGCRAECWRRPEPDDSPSTDTRRWIHCLAWPCLALPPPSTVEAATTAWTGYKVAPHMS
ncbi:hypothetical protein QBC39DRAFT_72201 [Podospora conica]|nr:hypothetical protein QBC39DRAFT_72201 [Schizothecium conicum]